MSPCVCVQVYTAQELAGIEAGADSVNSKAQAQLLPPACYHVTAGRGGLPKRTKFFFGARYLWTREQMSHAAAAKRAHGVRGDVPPSPAWMQVTLCCTGTMKKIVGSTGFCVG